MRDEEVKRTENFSQLKINYFLLVGGMEMRNARLQTRTCATQP